MNQHEWVYGCYAYYLENYIEPGNPEDGVWEAAHWPVPKCKGGRKTILLLKEHHAVHGVLQSEEWQTPCIWGWEKAYLSGEMLTLCEKWLSIRSRRAMLARTPEQWREVERKRLETRLRRSSWQRPRTPKEMQKLKDNCSDGARRMHAARSAEERSAIARKGHETRRRNAEK
jgi:hypothetical protein